MQKVHMYVLCISFDSPGARGCPRGKWKTHGGVVKTEYLQDPKGRNLKTWPHHMDDTLVIGSWKGTFVNILCLQPCAESNILNRGSCEASAGHCHQPRWDGHIADRDRWGRSNMKAVPTYTEFPCRMWSRLVAWRMKLHLQRQPKRLWSQLSRTSFSVFLINVSMFKLYLVGQGRLDVEMPGVRRRNARGWRRNARGWRRNARGRRRNATCFCF